MADTIVELPDGSTTWRCTEHRGQIKDGLTGLARETVLTYKDVPDEIVLSRPNA
jgi:hypothetical protein